MSIGGLPPTTGQVFSGLTNFFANASGNQALTTAWADIPSCSFSLTAGTWLVGGQTYLSVVNLCTPSLKIYNATDAIDYISEWQATGAGASNVFNVTTVITLTGTKTITLAAKTDFSTGTANATVNSIPTTNFWAVKLS